jgi:hypothetical protein
MKCRANMPKRVNAVCKASGCAYWMRTNINKGRWFCNRICECEQDNGCGEDEFNSHASNTCPFLTEHVVAGKPK